MSDIRFNQWLHQSGTGGVTQLSSGHVGIGTTNPLIPVHSGNNAVLNVGVVTANNIYAGTLNGTLALSDISGITGSFTSDLTVNGPNLDISDKIRHIGDTNTAIRFPANDNISFETNGNETVRIDSSGRVLIGTTDAGTGSGDDLTISNSGNMGLTLRSTNSNYCNIYFSDATSGTATYEGYISYNHATDTLEFATGHTERLRIDSSGRILIGTTTAGHSDLDDLTISTSGNTGITIRSGTSSLGVIGFADGTSGNAQYRGVIQYSHSGDFMQFNTADAERLRIESTGAVEIRSTNGNNLLKLIPTASASTSIILNTWQDNSGGRNFAIRNRYSDHGRFEIMRSTANNNDPLTAVFSIDRSGNIGAPSGTNIYNASDSRLKKNVESLSSGLESIKSLRPVSFNWIDGFCDDEKEIMYGFIAQEVETVDSNLVEKFGNGSVEFGDTKIENTLRVKEKQVIPLLVKAIQELSAEIAALKSS